MRSATGANIASAMLKPPNSQGPRSPWSRRQPDQIASLGTRACASAGVIGTRRPVARAFIGQAARSAPKPECISAVSARATARSAASAGQPRPPASSEAYSQIAIDSQTMRSPWTRTGTRRVGENLPISDSNSGVSSGICCSSNARPRWRSSIQARNDQALYLRLPRTSARRLMRPRLRVPARGVNPSFFLRLAGLDPLGELAQVLLLLPFLLHQLAAVVRVVALLEPELVLFDALCRALGVVVAERERRIVEQSPHDLVARVLGGRHPDRIAELVELDAAMAEALLLGVVRHVLHVVADLEGFVLVAHRVTVLRRPRRRRRP